MLWANHKKIGEAFWATTKTGGKLKRKNSALFAILKKHKVLIPLKIAPLQSGIKLKRNKFRNRCICCPQVVLAVCCQPNQSAI